ncbi:hypothetical protein BDV25DRAFT_126366 [Aspergillus avenaceus]|uniref:Sorting nexin MVP1 n=1 Tax=Aspergillus avenaceus TaxID=36643 RepID=A0A5N6U7U5_ASPAV|nr:hypothetical protein BDV25DRAFT_126366 [Aspergillus avenaceus]
MAMGQEGQRAIHPFFRKGESLCSMLPTAILIFSRYRGTTDTPVVMLDHDPNTSRRKRRKTEKSHDSGQTEGSITNYIPPIVSQSTAQAENIVDGHAENGDVEVQGPDGSADPSTPSPEVTTPPDTIHDPMPNKTPQRRSSRQKTIKLNSNGKLLSSPVAVKPEEPKKKSDKKRGRPPKKDNIDKSKVVIFKYNSKDDTRQSYGEMIDDILNGRKRHIPSVKHRPPIRSTAKTDGPPKPTHPFFLKKSTSKTDPPQAQCTSQPSAAVDQGQEAKIAQLPSDKRSIARPSTTTSIPFTSFKQRNSKFPDPIHPVWPPQNFVHVRGLQAEPALPESDTRSSLELDRKKAKMAAISIHDKESVLSPEMQGLYQKDHQVLRIPERHVASGYILQRAIAEQLSQSTLSTPDSCILSDNCHPAIFQLYHSIPNSLTAFDRGDFESCLWTQKYAPNSATRVLQATKEASMLRDWLRFLTVSAVDTGKPSKDGESKRNSDKKKRKKRRKTENLDGFIVSSADEASEMDAVGDSDEDELAGDVTVSSKRTVIRSGDMSLEKGRVSNAILLSGPSGCGKTASIYAVAKELDFEVFELNPGTRRSARDIVERVGDMTRNHLVHNVNGLDEKSSRQSSEANSIDPEAEDPKQNKLMGFFGSASAKTTQASKPKDKISEQTEQQRGRSQKQSFILLEEADLLFEEDKQFWSGVLTLIQQSKRPIIITCSDESLIPVDDISFHAILRYRPPPQHLVVDYCLLLAANEGHMLKREAIDDLYVSTGRDFRRTITELNFWCQIAIGSEKSGLDWMIDRWPRGADLDEEGNPLRVISMNSYEPFMGWFSRDMLMIDNLDSEIEAQRETFSWWDLGLQDAERMTDPMSETHWVPATTNLERLDRLQTQADLMDMRSVLDILSFDCSLDLKMDSMDTSVSPMPGKRKPNYIEGYPLLDTELMPNHSSLSIDIATTFEVLIEKSFRPCQKENHESWQAAKVLASVTKPKPAISASVEFARAFAPVMKASDVFPLPTGRLCPSFENGLRPITEDLGPYVRAIMAFDLRLEQYRLQLSGLLSENGQGTKRIRTTRASRAALEGGSKTETRKERWFPSDTNPTLILATGNREWQDLLVQNGYFTVNAIQEPIQECSDPTSEGSGADINSAQKSKSSLFADEFGGNNANPGSSLFADDDGLGSGSPWNNNTNKRAARHKLVKTLLSDSEVPESYVDAYDLILSAGDRVGAGIGLTSVREILSGSGISASDQAKILNLVISGDIDSANGLGRGEFNVLLALVGLAQEGEDLTLDAVDDRRMKLPSPKSSYLNTLRAKQESGTPIPSQERPTTPPRPASPLQEPNSTHSRQSRRNSLPGYEEDPWGSPQLHRGHAHAQLESDHPVLNGYGSVRSATNAWSGRAGEDNNPTEGSNNSRANGQADNVPSQGSGFGWGESGFGNTPSDGGLGGQARTGLGGFGSSGSDNGESNPRRRSLGIGRVTSPQLEEVVTVTLLPEKEGMFMFQHRNYEVKSARRGSTVVRRYSDFVWLLDCLHKRYPFRQLPLLPPKRLSVNGTHLSADSNAFLEKRRRGLVRFTNALIRHPVLSQEQLVIMFLTVPTELSVWRKQATISVQDEFTSRALPPDLEDSLPSTLTDTFETVRSGVKRSAEIYINLCTLLERLAKRNEGLAADHLRFSLALQSLTEVTRDTYAIDTNDVPLLNEGIRATANHLSASQSLLEDEARAWEQGVLEDLKRQRDCLVSVREMFDRRDRYARNNIPQLERRIEYNERRLQDMRTRPQGTVKPGEIEKVEEAIIKDKESIVEQHARGVFIKECIRDEIVYFQQSQYHISRLHQDWSQERVKYAELQADNWRSLSDQVEDMPLGD